MIDVTAPGLLTTVQDLGRHGHRHLGVASAGAADRDALRVGNRLVGNDESCAAIELTLSGPTLAFRRDTLIALTGGECEARCGGARVPMWRPVLLRRGSELALGRVRTGVRSYVAVAGGIDVPCVLGSRSTDLRGGFGGFEGRALRARDRLRVGRAPGRIALLERRLDATTAAFAAAPWWVGESDDLSGDVSLLHLLPGKDVAALDPRVVRALRDGVWTVRNDSDRMGLRFDGPPIPRVGVTERISEAVLPGAVQLPPDGRPIVLGVDAQTVGGYPVIAQVIRADLCRAMQLRPGARVHPVLVDPDAAASAYRLRRQSHARLAQAIDAKLGRPA